MSRRALVLEPLVQKQAALLLRVVGSLGEAWLGEVDHWGQAFREKTRTPPSTSCEVSRALSSEQVLSETSAASGRVAYCHVLSAMMDCNSWIMIQCNPFLPHLASVRYFDTLRGTQYNAPRGLFALVLSYSMLESTMTTDEPCEWYKFRYSLYSLLQSLCTWPLCHVL